MDRMVEQVVEKCISCQATGDPNQPEPIQPTETPKAVWDTVHIDYLGPLPLSNKYVLVIIDQRSRYPEIEFLSSTSATQLITALHRVFATYGNPHKVVTDNGPPFQSKTLREFMDAQGIQHHRITPLWPQVNGQVERFNRPLMKAIKAACIEGKDMQTSCYNFLASYRATPHPATKIAPARMMFGRTTKHLLPHIPITNYNNQIDNYDKHFKTKSKSYTDRKRHTKSRKIQIGDQVLVKQRKRNKLSANFDIVPYLVTNVKGTMITAHSPTINKMITRNISHFKPLPKTAELPIISDRGEDEEEDIEFKPAEPETRNKNRPIHQPTKKTYPNRIRRPLSEWRKY